MSQTQQLSCFQTRPNLVQLAVAKEIPFTTEKKFFVIQMLQPPAALPRTSVLTQEMRLLSKHQSGAIYIQPLRKDI